MNALENWFKGILSGAIEGCLNTVNDMLSGALNNSDNTGVNGIFSQFLGNPTTFTGTTGSGGTSIWTTIEKLSNNVIVPIGAFMLMIVVCYELFSMVVEGNNFKDFDDSIFIRWILKTFCEISTLYSEGVYSTASTYGYLLNQQTLADYNIAREGRLSI